MFQSGTNMRIVSNETQTFDIRLSDYQEYNT